MAKRRKYHTTAMSGDSNHLICDSIMHWGQDLCLDVQPTAVSVPPDSLGRFCSDLCHPCGIHLLMVTTPIESGNIGKRVLVSSVSTMVLSEARGLSLSLVIRGGIA